MNKLNLKPLPIRFTEEGHIHEIRIGPEWQPVPGCTTVSGLFQDDGWKFAWPVKLMANKLKEDLVEAAEEIAYSPFDKSEKFCFDKKTLYEFIDDAKNAWRRKRDKAADTGVIGHKNIENFIDTGFMTPTEDKEIQNIASNFLKWNKEYKPEWLASEVQVGSFIHKYCGILDAVAVINGEIVLMDFKTSSSIKPDYNIQLAGLALALQEQGFTIDKRAILHLPKEGEYTFKYIETDLKEEQNDFLSGLDFLRRKNMFMGRNK